MNSCKFELALVIHFKLWKALRPRIAISDLNYEYAVHIDLFVHCIIIFYIRLGIYGDCGWWWAEEVTVKAEVSEGLRVRGPLEKKEALQLSPEGEQFKELKLQGE